MRDQRDDFSPLFCWRVMSSPLRMVHPLVWLALGVFISTCIFSGPGGFELPQNPLSKKSTRYQHESRLSDYLNYRARSAGLNTRPGQDNPEPAKVFFGVSLFFIEDLINQKFGYGDAVFRCVNRYLWQDERLQWDPQDFGGVTVARVPVKNIWSPDIRLLNSMDFHIDEDRDVVAIVSHTGKVLFLAPSRHRIRCLRHSGSQKSNRKMDPYDWDCTLRFASWTYDGKSIDLDFYPGQKTIDLGDFQQKFSRLKVVNTYVERQADRQYKEPFPDLQFHLMLQEKPEGGQKRKQGDRIPVKGKPGGGKGRGGGGGGRGKRGGKGGNKGAKGRQNRRG
ncbi:hypothetical protein CAPTEDRAFT_199337 [Capitella teleta]|uniref:Neurotransmitter-gated ion-channel ligand-binding domain-containing protein n=1 Tax=Capitella teleta TaxID=283909 RepID=R7TTN9_CAPTE|nr:hypothetical protein CAPTEDRAFT_199337 [Capitella teleta]|eukprot:ELT97278.1 hypothetical protein CAPTEDRAFT_199337 [Capitella teleta]